MRVAVHAGQLRQPIPGGIGRYVRELLRALPGAGVEPVPFAAGPAPDHDPALGGWRDLGWPRGSARYELWHRLRRPRVAIDGTDVVHATSLAVAPSGRRPLVVTIHDLVGLHHPELLTPRGIAFHRRGLALARQEAAVVVTPTAAVGAEVAAEGIDATRIHVAHHGVAVGPAPSEEATAAVLETLGVVEPFVLFVGTLEPRKGIADLLEAQRRLGVTVVLAGARGWGELPPLDRPGVVAPGGLDDATLDCLYRRAVALALPSQAEGFGLPVLEAMARGCPVVTSDTASLVEVAGEAGVAVAAGDVDGLSDALARLVGDPDWRADRAAAGRRRSADFTWAASAAAHRQAYESAVRS